MRVHKLSIGTPAGKTPHYPTPTHSQSYGARHSFMALMPKTWWQVSLAAARLRISSRGLSAPKFGAGLHVVGLPSLSIPGTLSSASFGMCEGGLSQEAAVARI